MKIEPRELIFRDIRLNVASTTSFTIENPLTAAVEFTLRASAPARYDIKPSQIVLAPKQSIVVTVCFYELSVELNKEVIAIQFTSNLIILIRKSQYSFI